MMLYLPLGLSKGSFIWPLIMIDLKCPCKPTFLSFHYTFYSNRLCMVFFITPGNVACSALFTLE